MSVADSTQPVPERGLSIAEAARRTGLTVYTLRYYERSGMLPKPPRRTSGGSRRYHAAELHWIQVCTRLRGVGMPIELIRRYIDMVRSGPGNERERLELFESHRARIVDELATLGEQLQLMDHKIDVYRQRVADGDGEPWPIRPDPEPVSTAGDL
ncbi:MerR family transcriptional regulator [Nocardia alni]|uniref:MerR family transcriptional regulator n=1 Tax=Nocardia alni TaxID=2815723 RepID=UPI001C2204D0|nr:MerR family transcriptional regulator [Nocardia alni]